MRPTSCCIGLTRGRVSLEGQPHYDNEVRDGARCSPRPNNNTASLTAFLKPYPGFLSWPQSKRERLKWYRLAAVVDDRGPRTQESMWTRAALSRTIRPQQKVHMSSPRLWEIGSGH